MKIGTRYLHVFIDSEINTQVNNIMISPQNYGQWTEKEKTGIKHRALNHIRTTTRINKLSKLELKRQEQELIDAEVERRLKKEEFEKKVLVKLQDKKQTVKNTIVMKDTIQNYIERMDKDISRISLLGEL
jgi:16S rRNA U1498 N3-methylase RsmE